MLFVVVFHFILFRSIELDFSTADVEAGMCLHDDTELKLMRIADTAIAEVSNLDGLCDRCQDAMNFETDAETGASSCICTPHCGSCDPNPAYSDKDSGYMCINLSAYVDAETSGGKAVSATLVPGTGGVHQGTRSSTECTFGRSYRNHKRGAKYDAAVSNIPTHSIAIIDMEKMEKKCAVDLPSAPRKVIYAPNEPVTLSDSAGATKTVSFALVVIMGMVAAMI